MRKGEEQHARDEAVRPAWLTYKQAAELSGLGRTTLWSLVSTGRVRAAKVGTAVRISRTSLQGFMELSSYSEAH